MEILEYVHKANSKKNPKLMYLFYLKFLLRFYNDVMQSHSYCFKMSINSVLGEERNWFGEVCFFKDFYLKDRNSCHKADEARR